MDEVHVCDLVLRSAPWTVDATTLSRAERRMMDLCACATDLCRLHWGEPVWRLVPGDKALMLRLSLVPRRQGWLFDVRSPGSRRLRSLADEAAAVFSQLQQAQIKLIRAARDLESGTSDVQGRPLDPVSAVLLKNSGRQWRLQGHGTTVQLEFPKLDRFTIDTDTVIIHGIVTLKAARRLELARVTAPPSVGALAKLQINRDSVGHELWHATPSVESMMQAEVYLHRCLFTRQIVGASLTRNLPVDHVG